MSQYQGKSCLYSDDSEEDDDDDYWKSKGQNKFSTAIFSDSDKEDDKPAEIEAKVTRPALVKSFAQNEHAPTSIGMSFLHSNPVSNRAISNHTSIDVNNTSINSVSSTSSNTSNSLHSYIPEYSTRGSLPTRPRPQVVEPRVFSTVSEETKPFTMPASLLGNGAFNKSKLTEATNSTDNKNLAKENIELRTKNSKLETELKLITSKLEDKPDYLSTINRIILDKPFTLDLYKKKSDKIRLLKEAINSNDGNAILAVVLFIKRTLTRDLFHGILINNPIGLNQYIFYLEQINNRDELAAFYKYHGNVAEAAAIKHFTPILCGKDQQLTERLRLFRDYEVAYTSGEMTLLKNNIVLNAVNKYLKLINIQKEILRCNSSFLRKNETKQDAMDNLKESSLSQTVSFCLKFARDLTSNDSYSMELMKKEFELTPKQYSIWFICSMAEIGSWTELENFTKQRGILNMVKNSYLSYESIVFIISHVRGPAEQIKKYLFLIENIDRRQTLAMHFKETEVIIDTYKLQRDKIGLMTYRMQFKENTPEYIKATNALYDDKVKWNR